MFQTSIPSAPKKAVGVASFTNLYAANEAKWWQRHFALGNRKSTPSLGNAITLDTPNNNVVSAISFDSSTGKKSGGSTMAHNTFAVASGPRVLLYGATASASITRALEKEQETSSIKADRQISTGAPSYCLSFRDDGRLVLIGGSDGLIRVCDTSTRATLKSFSETNASSSAHVRAVAWINSRRIISGGDDGIVRIWDFGNDSDKPAHKLIGHGDSVRSILLNQKGNILATGSYDHSIRLWDLSESTEDDDRCLAVLDHGAPVEVLVTLPGPAGFVASGGGTSVKVWDSSTGRLMYEVSEHSKTITSLCIVGDAGINSSLVAAHETATRQCRLLSGGLDGLLRVYDIKSLKCLHGVNLQSPITSLAASQDGMRIIIGYSTGIFSVRQRKREVSRKRALTPRAGTFSHAVRNSNTVNPTSQDFAVDVSTKRRKLQQFDKSLRKFRYSDALDQALASKQPEAVYVVLEELAKRRGLERALSNRDEQELEPIVSFTLRYITQPKYAQLLLNVCNKLCDIYGSVLGQSSLVDDLFEKIRCEVRREVRTQQSILGVLGQIETVINVASLNASLENNTA